MSDPKAFIFRGLALAHDGSSAASIRRCINGFLVILFNIGTIALDSCAVAISSE
jgi:hypothetical protein